MAISAGVSGFARIEMIQKVVALGAHVSALGMAFRLPAAQPVAVT